MSTKLPVSIEEIARHSIAPYTIYDKELNIICYKGIVLTPKMVAMLSQQQLYRNAQKQKDGTSTPSAVGYKSNLISKISKETTSFLIGMTKEFMSSIESAIKPPQENFNTARDLILDEVKKHIDHIQNIGELRINYQDYDLSHSINVSTLSTALAIKLNYNDEQLKELALGALLHDVGKTKLPKQIINKPGQLSSKEFEIIKLHAPLGYKIIKQDYGLSETVALAARDHQEYYDGSGYINGLQGEQIFKNAQIITIADSYDAASSDKVYAKAKAPKDIIKELLKTSKYYNPRILHTLIHLINYNTGSLKEKLSS